MFKVSADNEVSVIDAAHVAKQNQAQIVSEFIC